MKKKIIALLMVMCLFLTGCGGNDNSESSDVNSSASLAPQQNSDVPENSSGDASEELSDSESSNDSNNEASQMTSEVDAFTVSTATEGILNYVAFGDSIARGYGLSDAENMCYPKLFAEHLGDYCETVTYHNYAVDGMTSQGLLDLLNSTTDAEIANADLITLTIGANNVLGEFINVLLDVMGDYGLSLQTIVQSLIVDKDESVIATLEEMMTSLQTRLQSAEFISKINDGISDLKNDLPLIIESVRNQNPNAEILFTTIYSPYKGAVLSIPYISTKVDFSELSEMAVKGLNAVITENAEKLGYKTVDVYNAFDQAENNVVNVNMLLMNFDPHPNAEGHILITDECLKALKQS